MGVKVTNNAFGTISAGINSSATTVTLDSGQGARFPTLGGSDHFYGTLIDTSNNVEIIKVTARSTDSMTVVRAQDNTSARAFSIGDRFELRPTAKLFEDIQSDALIDNSVPDQSSHSGKFLTTDGTNVSWASAGSTSASDLTSGTLASARLPNGSVVKVSSFITNSSTNVSGSTDSTSFSNISNLSSLSHTMVDSTNQLLIFYMINWSGGGSTNSAMRFRILDGSTNITGTSGDWIGQQTNMADGHSRSRASMISGCINYDPNASSVTLNAQANAPVSGGDVRINGNYNNSADSNLKSTITVVEYAA